MNPQEQSKDVKALILAIKLPSEERFVYLVVTLKANFKIRETLPSLLPKLVAFKSVTNIYHLLQNRFTDVVTCHGDVPWCLSPLRKQTEDMMD